MATFKTIPKDDWSSILSSKVSDLVSTPRVKVRFDPESPGAIYTEKQSKPQTRRSIFDKHYPESTEIEWVYIDGCGWTHMCEGDWVNMMLAKCQLSGKTGKKDDMVMLEDEAYALKEEVVKAGLVKCAFSDLYFKADDMVDCFTKENKPIKVASRIAANHFFTCCLTSRRYRKNDRMQIGYSSKQNPTKITMGCTVASNLEPHKAEKCCSCGTYFVGEVIDKRADLGNKPWCTTCYVKTVYKNAILVHNSNAYPEAIRPKAKAWRMVDGEAKQKHVSSINNDRLLGVEVETEFDKPSLVEKNIVRHVMALKIRKCLGNDFVMIKEDGTLTTNGKYDGNNDFDTTGTKNGPMYAGFEIVSAAAPLSIHRLRWPLLEALEEHKFMRAWDTKTCGFHVHVTREVLSPLQVGRMLMFINHQDNKGFIQKVAGRGQHAWAKYAEKNLSDVLHPERVINSESDTEHNRRRRTALNVNTRDEATVEFRLFRGTVNPRHIIRNLEFCCAICDFCAPAARSLKEMEDYTNFIDFVDSNRKEWPLLATWFLKHELIMRGDITKPIKRKVKTKNGKTKTIEVERPVNKDKLTLRLDDLVEFEIKS